MPFGMEKHSFSSWLRKEVDTFEQTPGTRKCAENFTLVGGGDAEGLPRSSRGVIVELGTQVLENRPVRRGSGCHQQPSLGTGVAGKLPSAREGVWFHRAK